MNILTIVLLALALVFFSAESNAQKVIKELLSPVVEIEEDVYEYAPADNGANPLWNYGSTNLVRVNDMVFASGLETLVDNPPLNNTQCTFLQRDKREWTLIYHDIGRTREPCPLATYPTIGMVFMSTNPALNAHGTLGGSPARPVIMVFTTDGESSVPVTIEPIWQRKVSDIRFTEHSYRSFAVDGERRALILFQNDAIDTHAEWAFLHDGKGQWTSGHLTWPWGDTYSKSQPIRITYPNVALSNSAVHFVGVSNIKEPNEQWRHHKFKLTNKNWDYVYRNLYYNWSRDITTGQFENWLQIASREKTAGWIKPGDLWLAPDGAVHIVWEETAIDIRLREKFFPEEKQRHEMNYAIIRDGKIVLHKTLLAIDEGQLGFIPRLPRFHVTPDNRLFIFFLIEASANAQDKPVYENRILELQDDGSIGSMVKVSMSHPLNNYMIATVRAGTKPSQVLDLLGTTAARPGVVRYTRIRLY